MVRAAGDGSRTHWLLKWLGGAVSRSGSAQRYALVVVATHRLLWTAQKCPRAAYARRGACWLKLVLVCLWDASR